MSDDNNNGAVGTTEATPGGQNADATPAQKANGNEAAAPSHRDWNALAQNLRGLNEGMQTLAQLLNTGAVTAQAKATKPSPTDSAPAVSGSGDVALAKIAEMERKLALRDAFDEHGVSDPEVRELISAAASSPTVTDVKSFVGKYAAKLKPAQAQQAAAPKTEVTQVTAGTAGTAVGGAPAKAQLTGDFLAIDPATWAALNPEEKKRLYQDHIRKSSVGNNNPFAAARSKK